jgi:hypothetical protein
VRLFFGDEVGRPCRPEDASHWTWEGAPRWLYTREHPAPAHEMVMRADVTARCPGCARRALRVRWHEFKGGRKHLRCECAVCGRFLKHLKPPPANPDIEYQVPADCGT